MSSTRRAISTAGALLCTSALALLLLSASAQALEVHRFERSFGSTGSGPGELNHPEGVAVNDSANPLVEPAAGDVYVVDQGNDRVERFSASGEPLGQFNGSGTFEVVEGGVSKVEHGTAAPAGALSGPTQIAVDDSGSALDPSAGDVYVVDQGHGVIDKFSPTGEYIGQLTGSETPGGPFERGEASTRSIAGVAVDPSGVVWVSTHRAPIYSFSDAVANQYTSERETEFSGAEEGLAVDAEDDLYFYIGRNGGNGVVVKVNSAGETLANPFSGDTEAFRAAVDPVGHEVYLDNFSGSSSESIEAFSLDGTPIESSKPGASFPSFGVGDLTFSAGIAVNASDGTVYATDHSNEVVAFEAILLPTVKIEPLSEQQPKSVTLERDGRSGRQTGRIVRVRICSGERIRG